MNRTVFALVVSVLLVFATGVQPVQAHGDEHARIDALGKRIADDPDNTRLRIARATLNLRHGEAQAALADLRHVEQQAPGTPNLDLLIGRSLLKLGQVEAAVAQLDGAIAKDQENAHLRVARGMAYREGGRHAEAAADFGLAIAKVDQPTPAMLLMHVRALSAAGKHDAALKALDAALEKVGSVTALRAEGVTIEASRGRYEDAVKRLDPILESASRKEKWLLQRGDLHWKDGKYKDAHADYNAAQAAILVLPARHRETPAMRNLRNQVGARLRPKLVRGPYLQMGTPTSMMLCWRTDVPAISQAWYGEGDGPQVKTVAGTEATTEHRIHLEGLKPATRYSYSVGITGHKLTREDQREFSFTTAPPVGTSPQTRIWVLGDSGTANDNARSVRDAFDAWAGDDRHDLWLMLGDNAYNSGRDREYQKAVFDIYPDALDEAVLWPTLGNHDGRAAESATMTGPYYDIFELPMAGEAGGEPSGTEAYYSFDYANIHFVCLESHETDRSPEGAMMQWLKTDVSSTTQEWLIAFWHHPPYSKGSHDSDKERPLIEMRENALPILEAAGVDLVLAGHSHCYERSVLVNGHYGKSTTNTAPFIVDGGDGRVDGDGAYNVASGKGTVYAVAGSSGKVSGGKLDHPIMYVSMSKLGSVVIDVEGSRLDFTFLGNTPDAKDHFTLRSRAAR